MKFNKEQEDIINSIFGAYLINAPVGTGKTTVLIERIFKALEQGIQANEILALTFTNRAADEIKDRLQKKEIDNSEDVLVKTFHGFCAYFLKAEAKTLGFNPDFLILDEEEQIDLVRDVLGYTSDTYSELNRVLDKVYRYRLNQLQINLGHNIAPMKINDSWLDFSNRYLRELKTRSF